MGSGNIRLGQMKTWRSVALSALTIAFLVEPATAGDKSYDNYWKEATRGSKALVQEHSDFTVVTPEDGFSVYIFTKPGNPAHPGVVIRTIGKRDIVTEGHSFGTDDAQPAFKAWMNNPFKSETR